MCQGEGSSPLAACCLLSRAGSHAAPANVRQHSPALVELTQTEPSPSAPLVANSPLPTSLPLSLAVQLTLPAVPEASTGTSAAGHSIPSAPAAQVTQREPTPPEAQQPQQPLPAVPPLIHSISPLRSPRKRPSPQSTTVGHNEAPEKLQDQDVRRPVVATQHVWQQAIWEAQQLSVTAAFSPRGAKSAAGEMSPAVSLLDIDPVPMPGLDMSISAIGDMSPIVQPSPRSPHPTPAQTGPDDVMLTHNAMFDQPLTPASVGLAPGRGKIASGVQKSSAVWHGRASPDENSSENVPAFLGQ